jgi:acetyltransferase
MKTGRKPLYPVLPSVENVKDEIRYFIDKGGEVFFDEVSFGRALAGVYHAVPVFSMPEIRLDEAFRKRLIEITDGRKGYLDVQRVRRLLQAAGLHTAEEKIIYSEAGVEALPDTFFPLVMKGVGLLHKTEHNAVRLNISNKRDATIHFKELMRIPGVEAVLVQPYYTSEVELYAGAVKDAAAGHLLMFGTGGTGVEIWKDIQKVLLPASYEEWDYYTKGLKIYPFFENFRGKKVLDKDKWLDFLWKLQNLILHLPEIREMDINPVLFTGDKYVVVDSRINLE